MAESAPARQSLFRELWPTKTQALYLLVIALLIAMAAVAAGFLGTRRLLHWADILMFMGYLLVWTAQMSDPASRERAREWRRRWLAFRKRSTNDDEAPPPRALHTRDPHSSAVVALSPLIASVGCAAFGLALGLVLIGQLTVRLDGDFAVERFNPWVHLLNTMLFGLFALFVLTDSPRRLYTWGQERAAAAATAQADADRARMAALQAQMNPHFLFNALNTVAALLSVDGSRARATVQNLSGMLKHTLDRSAQPTTTVGEELQFVRDYLAIERERFGSRMTVTYEIDPEVEALSAPTMSLQPLVENAIKHAVTTRLEGGSIRISASRPTEQKLRLSVEDDGPGFPPDAKDGTGLRNLRERLRTLYGGQATIELTTSPSGAKVTMTIPQGNDRPQGHGSSTIQA